MYYISNFKAIGLILTDLGPKNVVQKQWNGLLCGTFSYAIYLENNSNKNVILYCEYDISNTSGGKSDVY